VLQLLRGDFPDVVRRVLDDTGVPPSALELELTESVLMANAEQTAVKLQAEHALTDEARLRFFIPGGAVVTADHFLALTHPASVERGVKALRVAGFRIANVPDDPVAFERAINDEVNRAQRALYLGDPLGIDIVIAYLAMKANEVANLRLVARSKALGLTRDRVRKELVGV